MTTWYCIHDGIQRGPMSRDELFVLIRGRILRSDDYVWTEDFGREWRRLQDVPELAQVPPPGAPAAMKPAPATTPASAPEFSTAPRTTEPDAPRPNTPPAGAPGRRPAFRPALYSSWDRMREILFRNRRGDRWLALAFCVWISIVGLHEPNLALVALDNQIRPDTESLLRLQSATTPDQLAASSTEILQQMGRNARQLLTPAVLQAAAAAGLLILLVTTWLRARGAFMLVHAWHHPDATVAACWRAGRALGRDLFLCRLLLGTVTAILTLLLGYSLFADVLVPLQSGAPCEGALLARALALVLGISLVLTFWLTAAILLTHFVVPVMYWRRVRLAAACRTVLALCNEQPAAMTIWFTMYLVLAHVAVALLAVLLCCTCCCASYLLMLPFINGLLFLPASLFFRGLGIACLRQWRPELETGPETRFPAL